MKETVCKEDRKESEETNPPNGYLVTKPSPVRPHGWEHEEGNISRLPVLPPPAAQLSLPPAHSNVPGAKGDTVNTSLLISQHTIMNTHSWESCSPDMY